MVPSHAITLTPSRRREDKLAEAMSKQADRHHHRQQEDEVAPCYGSPRRGSAEAAIKSKRKLKITQKAIKDRILITCFLAMAPEKRGMLTVYNRIKLQVDLQADKSPIVVVGPFFPRVVNPRYRIRGTNV
jgi:hypothetical protein